MKEVRLIEMCQKNLQKIRINVNFSDASYGQNCRKQGELYHNAFKLCSRMSYYEGPRKSGSIGIKWNTSAPGL
jgi:hypothetical protein